MAGRVVLVTGATRGLGRALTARFVEGGHTVLGCGRSAEHIAELSRKHPAPHRFTALDVTIDRAVAAWSRSLLADGLVPDLVLNNAAVINATKPLWEISAAEFQQILDVNIAGVVNVIRHFVPAMIARGRGVIVNFSSGWGRSTSPEVAPYCASKFAIEGLTQALAQELPKGLAAVPLNPGIIDTDMLRSCWADEAKQFPGPEEWSRVAAPYILQLDVRDNGMPRDVPL